MLTQDCRNAFLYSRSDLHAFKAYPQVRDSLGHRRIDTADDRTTSEELDCCNVLLEGLYYRCINHRNPGQIQNDGLRPLSIDTLDYSLLEQTHTPCIEM